MKTELVKNHLFDFVDVREELGSVGDVNGHYLQSQSIRPFIGII